MQLERDIYIQNFFWCRQGFASFALLHILLTDAQTLPRRLRERHHMAMEADVVYAPCTPPPLVTAPVMVASSSHESLSCSSVVSARDCEGLLTAQRIR